MEGEKNRNHPRKGARIAVEPIRSIEDVKSISKLLYGYPRAPCVRIDVASF
jgi:hypothetical protein